MLGLNFYLGNLVSKILHHNATPPEDTFLFLTSSGETFMTSDNEPVEYKHT